MEERVEDPSRKRDAQEVIATGPQEVELNAAEDGVGQVQGGHHIEEVIAHQDNLGGFTGHLGACS